ncbi:WhiB family transcriptional regulator [Streptomyces sp. NPDC059070]|uniref:WhiB family transcriptional regulator n=1 Tax=Streptomyces sp. NPDC059070 TaxID=3346713 RepID=UPI00368DB3F0
MRHITTNTQPVPALRGIADTSWHARGRCHGLAPAEADRLFFPAPRAHRDIAEAKSLCGACPVRQDCFTHALDNDLRWGLWGGMTEAERKPWRAKIAERLDYTRVRAALLGRDVHLSPAERDAVTRHAALRGWTSKRLAYTLAVEAEHARDLLRQARQAITDRDRHWEVPPHKHPGHTPDHDTSAGTDEVTTPRAAAQPQDGANAPADAKALAVEETFCAVSRQIQTSELIAEFGRAA